MPANWKLVPFLPKLWEEMAWADLVVCRAGALTVAELAAAGRPSILVPFVGGGNHQIYNAKALYQRGAAALMEEHNLTAENLAGAITEKLEGPRKARPHGTEGEGPRQARRRRGSSPSSSSRSRRAR